MCVNAEYSQFHVKDKKMEQPKDSLKLDRESWS